ncbi:MAG: MBOAT family O-acyltransferase [Pelolinea sp.]|nr:MBOAT family O-acyltransferase [Pelolinea sp.]
MTFNTFLFYLFFIVIVIVNYLLPRKWRWVWLLISSYVFYSFSDIRFLAVLLICTGISFIAGRMIARDQDDKLKKIWMLVGVFINVAILILFKYVNFFFDSISTAAAAAGLQWTFRGIELLYPIGISFYTIQVISYLLDVYNKKIEAENNLGHFALYVSFFPQLLIGPIERYNHLKPQLLNPIPFKYQEFADSLVRIGWGLFKKIVIADRLAVVANTVFSESGDFESPKLIAAVLAFSFQIYIDFSAYSDIAIGSANILGIKLVENFERPYFARSVIEFWRRWHISLSNWLRDYIFLKLNYKHRRRKPRAVWMGIDVMITFLISGLWHGANWTFVIWGALHGVYQTIEILTQKMRDKMVKKLNINRDALGHKTIQVLFTFGLVCFAWIFFKANSIDQALQIIRSIGMLDRISAENAWIFTDGSLGLDAKDFWMMTLTLVILLIVEFLQHKHDLLALLNKQPTWLRWAVYYTLFFSITIFGFYGEANVVDFVYFQF